MLVTRSRMKLAVAGAENVGKTNICSRFLGKDFVDVYSPTGILDSAKKEDVVYPDGYSAPLLIWDMSSDAKDFKLHDSFVEKDTDGLILVYDVTNRASFQHAQDVYERLKKFPLSCVLVGNKMDLLEEKKREVTNEEASVFAKANGMSYIEASAKTNTNIGDIFQTITRHVLNDQLFKSAYNQVNRKYEDEVSNRNKFFNRSQLSPQRAKQLQKFKEITEIKGNSIDDFVKAVLNLIAEINADHKSGMKILAKMGITESELAKTLNKMLDDNYEFKAAKKRIIEAQKPVVRQEAKKDTGPSKKPR